MKMENTEANYKDIKNYLHNNLGINKEEIKNIIWNTIVKLVNEEVQKCLNDEARIKAIVEGQVRYEIGREGYSRRSFIHNTMDDIYNRIDGIIHEEVLKRLVIELKESDDE